MSDTHFCLLCGKTIGIFDKVCKYCGEHQFGENDEFYPDEKAFKQAAKMLSNATSPQTRPRKKEYQGPTVEEQLVFGWHPDDEMYRKTLELEVLSKKYK